MTETNVALKDLRTGDKVHLYLDDVVTSVNDKTGKVRLKSGAAVRMTRGYGWDAVGETATLFKADVTGRSFTTPANWPPKPGEVWTDNSEASYMIINGPGGVRAYTSQNIMVTLENLKERPGLKRAFGGVK